MRNLNGFVSTSFGLVLLVILIFWATRWLQLPAGQLIDWVIGTISCWWLLVITTVPWNIHFEALHAVSEGQDSINRGIAVDARQVAYARKVASVSLVIAIALHMISAGVLFALSATGITVIGYVGSAAALLLTALRPAVRGYEYLYQKLLAIRHHVRYPREDVVLLTERVAQLEAVTRHLNDQMDLSQKHSFASRIETKMRDISESVRILDRDFDKLDKENQKEHERLSKESERAIAKLSADSQFLNQVSDLIRFIKAA
jgi:hypothetical protein